MSAHRPQLRLAWLVLIAAGATIVVHVVMNFLTATRLVREEIALIREKGQPTSWYEIDLLVPSTPESRAARSLWEEAFALYRAVPPAADSDLVQTPPTRP